MKMSVSAKKATNKTSIKHNNRDFTKKQKEENNHINYNRSAENILLVQKDLKELYEQEFDEPLKKYNEKQKRKDRKIDDYYQHIKNGKKTSLQQEMIIQVGDKDDFFSEENREVANEILGEWFKDFQERNPNLKVYNAIIHNDEASPHLHLNFVPVASGYKRGLEKQVSFDRAIIQQDPTLDKKRPFKDWRDKEVDLLAELMQKRGIERKFVGTNEYKDVNEYKEKKDLEREVENKRLELNEIQSDINTLETAKNVLETKIEPLERHLELFEDKIKKNREILSKQGETFEKQKRWQQNFSGASALGETMQEVKRYKAYVPRKNALGVTVLQEEPKLVSIKQTDYDNYDKQLTAAHQARLIAERRVAEERLEKEKILKKQEQLIKKNESLADGEKYWFNEHDKYEKENIALKQKNTVLQEKVNRMKEVFIQAHSFVDEYLPDFGDNQYKKNFHEFLDRSKAWIDERIETKRQIDQRHDEIEL